MWAVDLSDINANSPFQDPFVVESFCPIELESTSGSISLDSPKLSKKRRRKYFLKNKNKEINDFPPLIIGKGANSKAILPQAASTPQTNVNSTNHLSFSGLFGNTSSPSSSFVYQEILTGVHVYVEVRSDWDDVSLVIGEHLLYLGATVLRTFTKKATHLVFKNGKLSTFKKAEQMKIHIVSVLWIDMCKRNKKHMPESLFPIESPLIHGKTKRVSILIRNNEKYSRSFDESLKTVNSLRSAAQLNPINHDAPKLLKRKHAIESKKNEPKRTGQRKLFRKTSSLLTLSSDLESTKESKIHEPTNRNKNLLQISKTRSGRNFFAKQQLPTKVTQKNKDGSFNNASRKSLEDFKLVQNKRKKKKPKHKGELKFMVLTKIDSALKEIIFSVVSSFGGFQITAKFVPKTTHVICGERMRTLNVLFGLVQGCWILSPKWILDSLEAGYWLDETKYELEDYFPAVAVCRKERQLKGHDYTQNLFHELGNIFISPNSIPPCELLTKLVKLAGGKITTCVRQSKIIIGDYSTKHSEIKRIKETIILDSISQHRKLNLDDIS